MNESLAVLQQICNAPNKWFNPKLLGWVKVARALISNVPESAFSPPDQLLLVVIQKLERELADHKLELEGLRKHCQELDAIITRLTQRTKHAHS
jgi:hypothetical protein